MKTLVPQSECMTSAWHLATAACLRSTPPQYRQPKQWCCCRYIHGFGTELARCVFVKGRSEPHLRDWKLQGMAASVSWLRQHGKQRSSASYASLVGCMRWGSVCEADWERSTALSTGDVVRLETQTETVTKTQIETQTKTQAAT